MSQPYEGVRPPRTGAEAVLIGLKAHGVEYVFANAGTDFPPIIEAFAALGPSAPVPVTVPHETAAVAMAHGYYLASGQPQAVMVHVNVGLANAAMGVINAASDSVPMLVMSGRTPLTEHGRLGARVTPMQYGQEMVDQTALVAGSVKYSYEMRYPEQGAMLAGRALTLATSAPMGPVYLSLPREPLCEAWPEDAVWPPAPQHAATAAQASPEAIEAAAGRLAGAKAPLILCQRGDAGGATAAAVARLAHAHAIPVVEPFTVRNVMASDDPMFLGHDVKSPLADADVVLVVDSAVPWIERLHRPDARTTVIHLAPDPLFARMPVRSFQADLAIAGAPVAALEALNGALAGRAGDVSGRRTAIAARSAARRAAAVRTAAAGCTTPMTAEWLSHCLSQAMGPDTVVFNELGVVPGAMTLTGPNRLFTAPHSGGLGWAMGAALGAQLATPERLCAACIGDGSYMFANPVACHQVAEALALPILTIVKNNAMWNAVRRSVAGMYPDGAAARANRMPLTSLEPVPDFVRVAEASRAHAERVEHGADLPAALARAIAVIKTERRQALLDVRVAPSDVH